MVDFYGDINLLNHEMQNMAFDSETDFPSSPVVGRMVFKGFILYMCVDLNGILPIWIPVTNKINTYFHDQTVSATSWAIEHLLVSTDPVVQVYDSNNLLIIPDSIDVVDEWNVTIGFSTAITGRAVIMTGNLIPADGVGILAPDRYHYIEDFTSLATVVVRHNLGYYPIVRAFVGGSEVQPQNVVHDDIFQTTVTFSSAQTGILKFA